MDVRFINVQYICNESRPRVIRLGEVGHGIILRLTLQAAHVISNHAYNWEVGHWYDIEANTPHM